MTPYQLSILAAGKTALKSTCQLFNFKKGTKEFPQPNGCGVLMTHNGQYYVLSNAHVLADGNFGKTFVLMGSGKTMNIGGQYYNTTMPLTGNRKDDTLDIALVHLSYEATQGLLQKGYHFMEFSRNVQPGAVLQPIENVALAGYPASQTKIDVPGKRVISKPFIFRTPYLEKGLAQMGFPPSHHLIMRYAITKVRNAKTGVNQRGPHPRGMSGSGIWRYLKDAQGQLQPILIGIFSEYIDNRAVLVATKIDFWIDIIRQKVDVGIPNTGIRVGIVE